MKRRHVMGTRRWLVALALSLAACGGHGSVLPSIGVTLDIPEQTIPGFVPASAQGACNPTVSGVGNLGPDSILPINFNIRASKELQGRSFIGFARVVLDHISLTILIPPSQNGQTWDFLSSIEFFADVPGSNQPPVRVASLNPVPRGQTTIVIPGTGVDVSDIASQDKFEVRGQVTGKPPCADVHLDGAGFFDVSLF